MNEQAIRVTGEGLTLPFTLRMPTNRADNPDGSVLNTGTNHVDVQVILDPEMEPRGECRQGFGGPVIALREWDEQVFLHELLHAVVGYAQPLVATSHPPRGHEIISRIEVALWETGWRFDAVAIAERDEALARLSSTTEQLQTYVKMVAWMVEASEAPDDRDVDITPVVVRSQGPHPARDGGRMSERCEVRLEQHPTKPHLAAICTRPAGHDGEHCSVLHKAFDRSCPRCSVST